MRFDRLPTVRPAVFASYDCSTFSVMVTLLVLAINHVFDGAFHSMRQIRQRLKVFWQVVNKASGLNRQKCSGAWPGVMRKTQNLCSWALIALHAPDAISGKITQASRVFLELAWRQLPVHMRNRAKGLAISLSRIVPVSAKTFLYCMKQLSSGHVDVPWQRGNGVGKLM